MYFVFIVICFVVGPVVSIIIESRVRRNQTVRPDIAVLALRWFTFWIVGVRLLAAGASQTLQPEFTADTIFGTTDPTVLPFIMELGFANLAFGVIGIVSLFLRSWAAPAAVAVAVFLGLDGIRHLADGGPYTADRMVAMITDLLALVILAGCLIARSIRLRSRAVAAPAEPAR